VIFLYMDFERFRRVFGDFTPSGDLLKMLKHRAASADLEPKPEA